MSERLHSKFECVGTPAHVNVQDELELECLASRCVNMFGKPCDEVQCVLEGRTHFVTFCKSLTFSVFNKLLTRCPLRRRLQWSWTPLAFRPRE